MRRIFKWTVGILVVLGLLLALGVRRDRPAGDVEARWATPPSRFITVDGLRVHYRDRGHGPALVLLHGSSSSLFTWEGWADALSAGHRVVSLDLPGHGLTGPDAKQRYSASGMAEVVDRFATALGLERFSLAGNSMGGDVAWHYALQHPEKVDKLILVDALAYPQTRPFVLRLFGMPGLGLLARWVTPRFVVARSVHDVYGDPSRVTGEQVDRYFELLLREGNRQATHQRLLLPIVDDQYQRLSEIHTPTLILWGAKDKWILPANGERLAREIPGARLILFDGLGHVPMEEDPARSVAPVLAFLKD